MDIFRIHITSWTSSFRYPNMISGYQPTLPVPPLSTINGLISAAIGRYFAVTEERLGYLFYYKSKAVDLETIYQTGRGLSGIKSNVIKREFLFDNELYLYTDRIEIANAFYSPCYQLLLGRSGDLAHVNSVDTIEKSEKNELDNLKGTIIPFKRYPLPAAIQALPVCFTNEIPRNNIGTQPYCLLPADYKQKGVINAQGIEDSVMINNKKLVFDIYWQEF